MTKLAYPDTTNLIRKHFNISTLSTIKRVPLAFSDATHDIFIVPQQKIVIKQIRTDSLANSVFWQQMATEFNAGLFSQFEKLEQIYPQLAQISPLNIPVFLQQQINIDQDFYAFSASLMPGKTLQPAMVNKTMVKQLAQHLASCHAHGLIMPDLRWDQFLTDGKEITAFIDLDALIKAPIEIEFVILEYLLTPQQAVWFLEEYQKTQMVPNLSNTRNHYRKLLFNMNILGETDYQTWLKQPFIFCF